MNLIDIQVDYHDYRQCDSGTGTAYYAVSVTYQDHYDTYSMRRTFQTWAEARDWIGDLKCMCDRPQVYVSRS